MVGKRTCEHDTTDDSDSEGTSDFDMSVPFYERMIKKRRLSTSSSESEENSTEATAKQRIRENEFSWTQGDFQPIIHEFDNSNSGVKASVNEQSSVLDIFQIFFSEELVEFIVEQTNKYSENGDVNNSNVTTVPEMYMFLAVTMLMARIRKISVSEYWSKDKLIRTESFGEIMSRDRYTSLLRNLYFCDNDVENHDPIMKIQYVLEHLRTSFKTAFYPYEKLCIEESLLLFKGRCYFKQFLPSKRNRFRIKSFVLCDSKTGYIQDLIVYPGTNVMISEDVSSKPMSGQIVMTLLEPYLGKGHTLVTDNWYSSPSLFLDLHKNLTNAYGPIRKNRLDIPGLNGKMNKGECVFRSTKNVLALKWMDRREVWMISTCHGPSMVDTNKTRHLTNEKIIVPQCVIDYNKTVGAIGKVDQILYSLNSTRKNLKWYKKFFFHLFDLAVYNTFILYNCVTGKNLSFSKFHLNLIKQILQKYSSGRTRECKSKGRSGNNEPSRLTQRHFPSPYINNSAIRKNARRKCVVCRKHDRRCETHYQCIKCDVGLCIYPCFELYHTSLDY